MLGFSIQWKMYLQKRACWIQNIFGRTEWHINSPVWKYVEANLILGHMALHGLIWSYFMALFYGFTSALNVASSPLFPPPIMWYGNLCYKALLTLQHYWFFYLDSMDIEFLGIEKHLLTFCLYNRLFASHHRWIYIREKIMTTKKTIGQNRSSEFTEKNHVDSKAAWSNTVQFILLHVFYTRQSRYIYKPKKYPHPNGQYVMPSNYRLA